MEAEEILAYLAELLLMYLEELKEAKKRGKTVSDTGNRPRTRNVWRSCRHGKVQRQSDLVSILKRNIRYKRKGGHYKNALIFTQNP